MTLKSAVDGFNVSMLTDKDVNPLLGNLLNRGMNSMMSTLLFVSAPFHLWNISLERRFRSHRP